MTAGSPGPDDGLFDAQVAATYDADVSVRFADDVLGPEVELLAELAGAGPVLEFAVGTGRVAVPLAERGVEVHGSELSQAMVDVMQAKPGGDAIPTVVGDMATSRVPGEFSLVFLVFNTITNLLSQDAQVACFENAARHLAPDGRFLIENGVPELRRLPPGQNLVPFDVSEDHIGIDSYDTVTQRSTSHHTFVRNGIAERFDSHHRYVWPSELDLMARIAGLTLEHRWADWRRSPFTAESTSHVSVWRAGPRAPGDAQPTADSSVQT